MDMELETYVGVAFIILISALALGVNFYIESSICEAKTSEMGFQSDWSVLGGCRIEITDGRWIPLDTYYFKEE